MTRRIVLLLLIILAVPARAADTPLRFHYPDSGAPPWLFLAPGESKPTGIVADILTAVARQTGRSLQYEFQPRESAGSSINGNSADGALFFSATRPAAKGIVTTESIVKMDVLLITLQGRKLDYARPADLKDQRLCTLTEEIYPPLTLLAMNGTLMQRRAKTEQAQLMMLRNEDCVAAIVNGPMYHWLSARYRWDDLRSEPQVLLSENLVLGFAANEQKFADAVDSHVRKLRASGELGRLVQRYLPDNPRISAR